MKYTDVSSIAWDMKEYLSHHRGPLGVDFTIRSILKSTLQQP